MTATRTGRPGILHDERGMALALALIAIVVIGALVGGAFAAGRLEIGGGRASIYGTKAEQQAEMAITEVMINWDTRWNNEVPTPPAVVYTSPTVTSGSFRRSSTVTRLGGNLLEVRGFGETLDPQGNVLGTRQLVRLVRLTHPAISILAAVTATGNVSVGGNAEITGNDVHPAGWTCGGSLDSLGGVRTTGNVNVGVSASVTGDPNEIENDSTITGNVFTDPYNLLVPLRNLVFGSATSTISMNGMEPDTLSVAPYSCDRSITTNWGEPLRGLGTYPQCTGYFPIIHFLGSARLQDGRGQGVLLVGKDLELRGNFIFDGLIIVLGEIRTNGTNNKVTGAVLASNATLGDITSFIGDPEIGYSSCAVAAALTNSARGKYLNDRSWVQVY